ncbi:hypothetical protein MKX03_015553 [Papaver bracteatum]|nr:hypothetical protein MKX03_015552 [Papaver bracteatum]KAI3830848.1 hypothetical protein MKX03_015553 [Papaver bracteatum]
MITLVELLNKPKKDVSKLVNTIQALYEILIRDFPKEKRFRHSESRPKQSSAAVPAAENTSFYRQVRRLQTILTSRDSMHKR